MIRLGFIDSRTKTNIHQMDVIKQDISDDPLQDVKYNKGNVFSMNGNSISKTSLEFDFLTELQKVNLRNCLLESDHPKVFIRHPSGTNQFLNFYGITKPSSTHVVLYGDSDSANPSYGGTEISSTNYGYISDIDSNCLDTNTSAHTYQYIFLRFLCSSFDIATNNLIKRISLLLHNPYCYDSVTSTNMGIRIEYYNQTQTLWCECSRINYTTPDATLRGINKSFQHYAVIKPDDNFTSWTDIVAANNYVTFRLRNLQPRITNCHLGFNYAELLIDGWPVSMTNTMGTNFRDNVTLTGKTSQIELSEI